MHDGAAAIDFYAAAFGGVEDFRVVGDDGRLGHAEVRIGDARIQLSDEYPEMEVRSPRTLGGSGVALSLTVDDCDAMWQRAVDAGAEGLRPPEDQPHGNRMAVVRDPFGHRWFLLQPIETFDLATYAERSASTEFDVIAGAGRDDGVAGAAQARATLDGVWPALHYRDALGAIRFAVDVLGFEDLIVVADEDDPDGGAPLRAPLARGRHRPDRHVRTRRQRVLAAGRSGDPLRHHARPRVGAGALRGRRCGDRRPAAARSTTACRVTGCSRCATARAACGASAPTAPSGDPARTVKMRLSTLVVTVRDASMGQAAFSIFGV